MHESVSFSYKFVKCQEWEKLTNLERLVSIVIKDIITGERDKGFDSLAG